MVSGRSSKWSFLSDGRTGLGDLDLEPSLGLVGAGTAGDVMVISLESAHSIQHEALIELDSMGLKGRGSVANLNYSRARLEGTLFERVPLGKH